MADATPEETLPAEGTETVAAEVLAELHSGDGGGVSPRVTSSMSNTFMTLAVRALTGANVSANLGPQQLQLHSGEPGASGTNAVVSATPSNKQTINWPATTTPGSGGSVVLTAPSLAFSVTASAAADIVITHYSIWGSSGTSFLFGKQLSAPVTVPKGATGTITVTPSHTYDIT